MSASNPAVNPGQVTTPSPARDRLIVALDFSSADQALQLADALGPSVHWYKVGLELYLAAGNAVIHELVHRGHSVFLDLKLHDIPNTVAGAVRSAAGTGASLLTVHASGGPAMIKAAAAAAAGSPLQLLAVTVLTSLDSAQLHATGIGATAGTQVALLGKMAVAAGAHGLVCSAEESASLRSALGPAPLLVVPGIRPVGSAVGDQKRMATPSGALRSGASYLVVGRPITQAPDPAQAALAILAEMGSLHQT